MAGMTYTVATQDELYGALALVDGGDTILLAGGDYGELVLNHQTPFDFAFDSTVTLKSANADDPASFSLMDIRGAKNLTFDGINFDYTYEAGDALWDKPFNIGSSDNITIKNAHFDGDLVSGTGTISDGFGTGFGLFVNDSDRLTVENSEFTNWWKGASFNRSDDLIFKGNEIHEIRSDGINIAEMQGTVIEGNYIHDFHHHPDSPDHADMIQVLSNVHSTRTTLDLVIRDNVLDIGDGDITQLIYMANGKLNSDPSPEWLYQDIVVEGNMLRGAHVHGISVGSTDGAVIRHNTMLFADDVPGGIAPLIRTNESLNILIEKNAIPGIAAPSQDEPTWTIRDNLILQNDTPDAPGYVEDQFINSTVHGALQDFRVNPESDLARLGVGADDAELTGTLSPAFNINFSGDDAQSFIFDGSLTLGSDGNSVGSDATFLWDFGDGTNSTGMIVQHTYAQAGTFDVTLKVTLPDGQTAHADGPIDVLGATTLSFDAQAGAFLHHSYGEAVEIPDTDTAAILISDGDRAIDLGGTGAVVEIPPVYFTNFLGSEAFQLSMTFSADQLAGNWGEIVRIPGVLLFSVDHNTGLLKADLTREDGTVVTLRSDASIVNGLAHDIAFVLDQDTGMLELSIDGVVHDSAAFDGAISSGINHKMLFGNPWNGKNVEGALYDFQLDVTGSDYSTSDAEVVSGSTGTTSQPVPLDPVVNQPDPGDDTSSQEPKPLEPLVNQPDPGDDTSSQEPKPLEPAVNQPDPGEDTSSQDPKPLEPQINLPGEEPIDPDPNVEDAGTVLPELNGRTIDFATFFDGVESTTLFGGASLTTDAGGETALSIDDTGGYVKLGRMQEYEGSQQFSVEIDFTRADPEAFDMLLWNHGRLGIAMQDDDLLINLGQADAAFYKGLRLNDLEIDHTEAQTLRVIVDGEDDRIQVILNEEVVADDRGFDIDLVKDGLSQFGYMVGSPWSATFEGDVSGITFDDSADFIPTVDDSLQIA